MAFAIAAHIEPEILLVDEVLAVGDAEFQRKCLGRMAEIGAHGRTVVYISHNMPSVLRLCERVIVLDGGRVICDGSPQEAVSVYLDAGTGSPAERSCRVPTRRPVMAWRAQSVRVKSPAVRSRERNIQDASILKRSIGKSYSRTPGPVVAFQVVNEDGVLLFQTA